jgi:predicted nucleic acid-binding protein
VTGVLSKRPAVVDTLLLACAAFGVTDRRELAAAVIERAEPIWAPDSLRAELGNVAWQWVQHGGMDRCHAHFALRSVENLIAQFVSSADLLPLALDLAVDARHPVYDTLFVALAIQRETTVVTDDQRLLRAFPRWTMTAEQFLAAAAAG